MKLQYWIYKAVGISTLQKTLNSACSTGNSTPQGKILQRLSHQCRPVKAVYDIPAWKAPPGQPLAVQSHHETPPHGFVAPLLPSPITQHFTDTGSDGQALVVVSPWKELHVVVETQMPSSPKTPVAAEPVQWPLSMRGSSCITVAIVAMGKRVRIYEVRIVLV